MPLDCQQERCCFLENIIFFHFSRPISSRKNFQPEIFFFISIRFRKFQDDERQSFHFRFNFLYKITRIVSGDEIKQNLYD